MIHGTPRDANSLSPVPSAARPSRTARRMLFSFMDRTKLPSRGTESHIRLVTQVQGPSSRLPLRRGRLDHGRAFFGDHDGGCVVLVDVTAGMMHAPITRGPSIPCTRN